MNTMKNTTETKPNYGTLYREFKVAAFSKNTNAFGLTGVLLVSREGEAYEAGTYTLSKGFEIKVGETVLLPVRNEAAEDVGRYNWASAKFRSFESPRRLEDAPAWLVKRRRWPRALSKPKRSS